jgi:hypothetical protein
MAEPVYTTPAAVRTEAGVDTATLDDAAANRLILIAEDIADDLLGGWPVDTTTGRKIIATDVDAWQFDKLGRFTALLAAKLYANPALTDGVQWTSESGPDFSHSGPTGSPLGPGLLSILNASGLRRLAARARPGTRNELAAAFFGSTPQSWRL